MNRTAVPIRTLEAENTIITETQLEFQSLQNRINEYKINLEKMPSSYTFTSKDSQAVGTLTTKLKDSILNITKDAKALKGKLSNRLIRTSSGNVLATTVGKVFVRYNYLSIVINGFIQQRILIENDKSAAKQSYINTVSIANKVLAKTVTDTCIRNAPSIFLTRVRRYVINFITDPLEELNRIVDDSNPDITDNYQGIVDNLKDTADNLLPRAQSAQTSTDNQCKEKSEDCDPNSFTILAKKPCPPDFERFTNEEEALESESKQGLSLKSGTFNQNKWIALPGVVDRGSLGKPKNYTHRIDIYMKNKSNSLSWLNLGKPIGGDGNGSNAEFKSNEPNRWGIFPDRLSEFNLLIKKIEIKKVSK